MESGNLPEIGDLVYVRLMIDKIVDDCDNDGYLALGLVESYCELEQQSIEDMVVVPKEKWANIYILDDNCTFWLDYYYRVVMDKDRFIDRPVESYGRTWFSANKNEQEKRT